MYFTPFLYCFCTLSKRTVLRHRKILKTFTYFTLEVFFKEEWYACMYQMNNFVYSVGVRPMWQRSTSSTSWLRRCAKITKRSSHLRVSGYFVQVQVPRRVWIAITNCDLPSNNIVLRMCSWWFDVCADKCISAALFMSFIKQCRARSLCHFG